MRGALGPYGCPAPLANALSCRSMSAWYAFVAALEACTIPPKFGGDARSRDPARRSLRPRPAHHDKLHLQMRRRQVYLCRGPVSVGIWPPALQRSAEAAAAKSQSHGPARKIMPMPKGLVAWVCKLKGTEAGKINRCAPEHVPTPVSRTRGQARTRRATRSLPGVTDQERPQCTPTKPTTTRQQITRMGTMTADAEPLEGDRRRITLDDADVTVPVLSAGPMGVVCNHAWVQTCQCNPPHVWKRGRRCPRARGLVRGTSAWPWHSAPVWQRHITRIKRGVHDLRCRFNTSRRVRPSTCGCGQPCQSRGGRARATEHVPGADIDYGNRILSPNTVTHLPPCPGCNHYNRKQTRSPHRENRHPSQAPPPLCRQTMGSSEMRCPVQVCPCLGVYVQPFTRYVARGGVMEGHDLPKMKRCIRIVSGMGLTHYKPRSDHGPAIKTRLRVAVPEAETPEQ